MGDWEYMGLALKLAQQAMQWEEVPVGAVVVCDGAVVGTGYNRRETGKNALAHAELEAIDMACRRLGGWRLHRCELFVTLEPCPMCAGAIINARIKRVVYGAPDPKAGCFGSVSSFQELPFNHKPEIVAGVRAQECAALLSAFFQRLRERRKSNADKRVPLV
ncbi:MAG: nucleoside deaminase [Anaerotruncus sp.]|nr:nucleoside deaminase [Anaerotruncus sp.]